VNIEKIELTPVEMPVGSPLGDEEDAPSSFPIDPIPDDSKIQEDTPASFPMEDPHTDDSELDEDRPLSFPIDPIPDDSGVKG